MAMRMTTNRAEKMAESLSRTRRTLTNIKNDLRTMRMTARGGNLTAIDDLLPLIVEAEAANERAKDAARALMQRMARIDAAKKGAVTDA